LITLKAVSVLHLNHFDLDRLGVASGDVVGVNGARGSVRLPVALDDAVPRGVTEIAFGSLDVDGNDIVRPILDGNNVISQVRLESA
jgi:anaerobic selenocysteine-containing dehydrogenase